MSSDNYTPPAKEIEALRHAQEHLDRIEVSTSRNARDQALLGALGYFQSLLNCGLITEQSCHWLNQKAMAQADEYQTVLCDNQQTCGDTDV
ncbi:hypothetical protein SFA35_25575 (plasmid) [Pseudomonas sp. HR96]|uniref:hypothetical protein n=1 Tax=Pseudomonas sp. HR96 TaxID=1027966 RepID=UPI002A75CE50|nr:hypothetical protein [Pseudomonas sp. HR96]WPP02366.1 hypothetical protein SFA35_25575 [Pseudomonas sp. HR96]